MSTTTSDNFDRALREEQAYLATVHPRPEDIPSCSSLFDTFLTCNGERDLFCQYSLNPSSSVVASQIKSYYRYGHMSSCSSKLEDFKFCLSLKALHPEEKREAWIRRRAEWWARRRTEKSSEDVWNIRG
jgi:hypothetical protein